MTFAYDIAFDASWHNPIEWGNHGRFDPNLTTIANQGGASPSSASRIESIEKIDLTGSGNNTLTLTYRDVIDMVGMNLFNNANGWVDGTYNLAAGGVGGINPEKRYQLVIDGLQLRPLHANADRPRYHPERRVTVQSRGMAICLAAQ